MTVKEFSDGFDTLINNNAVVNNFGITSSPFSFDEYEKSLFLSIAQEEVVRGLYRGDLNGASLEETEELRRSLDDLIKTSYPTVITNTRIGLDSKSKFYKLSDEVWFITYESVELIGKFNCKNNPTVRVVPMRQDEWHRTKENPFKRPNKRKVIRLDSGNNEIELISEYPIQNYLIRYLSKPTPIILTDFDEGLSIDGFNRVTECKLNTALHKNILNVAVELAKKSVSASK